MRCQSYKRLLSPSHPLTLSPSHPLTLSPSDHMHFKVRAMIALTSVTSVHAVSELPTSPRRTGRPAISGWEGSGSAGMEAATGSDGPTRSLNSSGHSPQAQSEAEGEAASGRSSKRSEDGGEEGEEGGEGRSERAEEEEGAGGQVEAGAALGGDGSVTLAGGGAGSATPPLSARMEQAEMRGKETVPKVGWVTLVKDGKKLVTSKQVRQSAGGRQLDASAWARRVAMDRAASKAMKESQGVDAPILKGELCLSSTLLGASESLAADDGEGVWVRVRVWVRARVRARGEGEGEGKGDG